MSNVPAGAQLSPDGLYWWDGKRWVPVGQLATEKSSPAPRKLPKNVAKDVEHAKAYLDPGEPILAAVAGNHEQIGSANGRNGTMLATDRRLAFYRKKMSGYDFDSFPYPSITSVALGKNMMGHHITLTVAGNRSQMRWIKSGGAQELVEVIQERIGRATAASAPAPVAVDIPAQIQQLAGLRDQGLLTPEEFEAKKVELLSRL
jgi:hypothetical protein